MKLICTNDECYEVPMIQLINHNKIYFILTDCSSHHYKFELNEYLNLLQNQSKEYNCICPLHNFKFIGFLKNYNINFCEKCDIYSLEEKVNFNNLENLDYSKLFENDLLKKLYKIVASDYINAKKQDKLVSTIYINLKYLNYFSVGISQKDSVKIKSCLLLKKSISIKENYQNEFNSINQYTTYETKKFDINSKYLIRLLDLKKIQAFIIDKNEYINLNNESDKFKSIEFNPNYEDIFLSVSSFFLKIWEINEKQKNIENKMTIYFTDNSVEINFAKFSPFNEKKIFSISENNLIQVWNMENIFNTFELEIDKKMIIKDIICSLEESIIAILNDNFILIYNILFKKYEKKIKIGHRYFNFINSKEFIIVLDNIIQLMSIDSQEIQVLNYESTDINNSLSFYLDNKYNSLYIFSKYIYIVNLSKEKFQITDKIESKNIFKFPMKILEVTYDDACTHLYFLLLKGNIIDFYSVDSNQLNDINNKIFSFKKNSKFFWSKKLKRIYRKAGLNFENLDIFPKEIYKKKYLNNINIYEKVKKNYNINLKQKKNNVMINLRNYSSRENIKEEYYHLLELIIQDNTNKQLINKYLNFLKNNQNNINNFKIYYENYTNELEHYKILFDKNELKNDLKEIKIKSEKENFIDYITYLLQKNDIDDVKSNIDSSKFGLFNQNIDFNKNIEAYWYRNKMLVFYALKKFQINEFNLMKYCINQIFKKELFEKDYIINNKQKLTFLIICMVLPQKKKICDYNLNLINSVKNNKVLFLKKLLELGFKKNIYNGYYYFQDQNNLIDPNKDVNICLENFILNEKYNLGLRRNEILIFDEFAEHFYPSIDIKKLKKYFINFLKSGLFKEAFYLLYSNNFVFPFQNTKDVEDYVNENITFLPIKNERVNGVTDKYTLETYIFLNKRKIYDLPSQLNNIDKELLLGILFTGGMSKTNIHELNHNLYNMCYYHSNGLIPLKTPRKKNLGSMRESGREMEILLFGSILSPMNINQIRYLLNEENFNKGVIEYRNDFIALNEKDLIIKGEFEHFNKIIENLNIDKKDFPYITTESLDDYFCIETEDNNDALG